MKFQKSKKKAPLKTPTWKPKILRMMMVPMTKTKTIRKNRTQEKPETPK